MKNILVPTDFSDAAHHVVQVATTLAGPLGAKIWIVHVAAPDPDFVGFDAGPQYVREQRADVLRKEHLDLQNMAKGIRDQSIEAEALLVQGPTSETLLDEVERLKIDLIVMGSHGRSGLFKALLGSVSEQVLGAIKIPVLIVPFPDRH
ncbi:MAG: universal stress protein [Flavobacteriales bacterium]|nr:universal stress protein [Flavobacteriales bacterium]MBP9178644.1 universal stress protein [Flavobacteriales bacterium]